MMNRRIRVSLWALALISLAIVPAVSQIRKFPTRPLNETRVQRRTADPATVELIKKQARFMTQQEQVELQNAQLPSVVDYSPYVTLVRDQGSARTCCIQSTAAIVDILKERERAYTPDVSESFISYAYQVSIGYYPKDSRINIPADGQAGVVEHLGTTTEASFSSRNYDPSNPGPPPKAAEIPTAQDIAEASRLKIADHKTYKFKKSDGLKPLKTLISRGPVGILSNDHCMAIIGYDDNTSQFTLQDSYGDNSVNRGFVRIGYTDMLNRLEDADFTVINNAPTLPNVYPYVARIKRTTPWGRNKLTIRVGTEGQQPFTVWAPPPYGADDDSAILNIDVPLPDYAGLHWPPSEAHPWYLEASAPGESGLIINDVVLVKRGYAAGGVYQPMLYRANATGFRIPVNVTEKVFIPARVSNNLRLTTDRVVVNAGQSVTFSGTLMKNIQASTSTQSMVPIANQEVVIASVINDPIEQTIVSKEIGRVRTDSSGRYQLPYTPQATASYQARAAKPDGTMIAVSNIITVKRP